MFKVIYTTQAELDLHDAIAYISEESISTALAYLSGYEEKIALLQKNPMMGVACKTKDIHRDCHILIYKNHLVIYKIDEENRQLLIVRIYHASSDYIKKLNS